MLYAALRLRRWPEGVALGLAFVVAEFCYPFFFPTHLLAKSMPTLVASGPSSGMSLVVGWRTSRHSLACRAGSRVA